MACVDCSTLIHPTNKIVSTKSIYYISGSVNVHTIQLVNLHTCQHFDDMVYM